jgi:hypothetical protein
MREVPKDATKTEWLVVTSVGIKYGFLEVPYNQSLGSPLRWPFCFFGTVREVGILKVSSSA